MQNFSTDKLNSFYESVLQLILKAALDERNISPECEVRYIDEIFNEIIIPLQTLCRVNGAILPNSLSNDVLKIKCKQLVESVITQLNGNVVIQVPANYGINNNNLTTLYNAACGADKMIKQHYRLACFREIATASGSIKSLQKIYSKKNEVATLIAQLTELHQIKADSTIADELTAKNEILHSLIKTFNEDDKAKKCIDEISKFTKKWISLLKDKVKQSVSFAPVMTGTEVKDSSKFKITNYTDITNEENKIQATSTHFDTIFEGNWNKLFSNNTRYTETPLALLPFYDNVIESILAKYKIRFAPNIDAYSAPVMLDILKKSLIPEGVKPISIINNNISAGLQPQRETDDLSNYVLALATLRSDKPSEQMLYFANAKNKIETDCYFNDDFVANNTNLKQYKERLKKAAKIAYASSLTGFSNDKIGEIQKKVQTLLNSANAIQTNIESLPSAERDYTSINNIITTLTTSNKNLNTLLNEKRYKAVKNFNDKDVLKYYTQELNSINPFKVDEILPPNQRRDVIISNKDGDPLIPVLPLIKREIRGSKTFDGTVGVGGCQLYPILAKGLKGVLGGDISSEINISSFFNTYRAQLLGEKGLFLDFIQKLDIKFGVENPNLDAHAGSALAQTMVEVNLNSQNYDVLEKSLTSDHTHCVAVKAEAFIEFMLQLNGKGNPQIALGALENQLKTKLQTLRGERERREKLKSENQPQFVVVKKVTIDDVNKEIRELNKQSLSLDIPPILAEFDLTNLVNLGVPTMSNTLPKPSLEENIARPDKTQIQTTVSNKNTTNNRISKKDEHQFLSDTSLQQLADQKYLQNFKIAGGINAGADELPSLVELFTQFKLSNDKQWNVALHINQHILAVNFTKNLIKQTIVTVANSSQDGQLTYGITSENTDDAQAISEINGIISTISGIADTLDQPSELYKLIKDRFKENNPVTITATEYDQIIEGLTNSNIKVYDVCSEISALNYIKKYLKPVESERFKEIKKALNITTDFIKQFPSLRQQNNYDCGIYTIYNLLDVEKGKDKPSYSIHNINNDRNNLNLAREVELNKVLIQGLNKPKQNAPEFVVKQSTIKPASLQARSVVNNSKCYESVKETTSKLNLNNLKPQLENTMLYKILHDEKSAIRIKDDNGKKQWKHKEILSQMSTILVEAITETKNKFKNSDDACKLLTSSEFIKIVINFAQKNNGVGNAKQDNKSASAPWKDFDTNNSIDSNDAFKIAKELSYQYQLAAGKSSKFLTGRAQAEGLKNVVGMRLKRIPEEYTDDVVNGAFTELNNNISK